MGGSRVQGKYYGRKTSDELTDFWVELTFTSTLVICCA